MRVLLDECLPKQLRRLLPGHVVRTVSQAGWSSLQNGALLRRIGGAYDVFITVDRNMPAQQNLADLAFGVVVLRTPSNRMQHLAPLAPAILAALDALQPGQVVSVQAP